MLAEFYFQISFQKNLLSAKVISGPTFKSTFYYFSRSAYFMEEQLNYLLLNVRNGNVNFGEVIAFIETYYKHQPTAFKNGEVENEANQNQGSAKVFAFAKLNNLSEADTISLFAEHYQSVVAHPDGSDHQNIRQFMSHGWNGITFEGEALVSR